VDRGRFDLNAQVQPDTGLNIPLVHGVVMFKKCVRVTLFTFMENFEKPAEPLPCLCCGATSVDWTAGHAPLDIGGTRLGIPAFCGLASMSRESSQTDAVTIDHSTRSRSDGAEGNDGRRGACARVSAR